MRPIPSPKLAQSNVQMPRPALQGRVGLCTNRITPCTDAPLPPQTQQQPPTIQRNRFAWSCCSEEDRRKVNSYRVNHVVRNRALMPDSQKRVTSSPLTLCPDRLGDLSDQVERGQTSHFPQHEPHGLPVQIDWGIYLTRLSKFKHPIFPSTSPMACGCAGRLFRRCSPLISWHRWTVTALAPFERPVCPRKLCSESHSITKGGCT
jgi:hypothetical protein